MREYQFGRLFIVAVVTLLRISHSKLPINGGLSNMLVGQLVCPVAIIFLSPVSITLVYGLAICFINRYYSIGLVFLFEFQIKKELHGSIVT